MLFAIATCVHCARQAAAKLTGIDWTRPVVELTCDEQVRAALAAGYELAAILFGCTTGDTCQIPDGY